MDRSVHTMTELFDQLGLASDDNSIQQFVRKQKPNNYQSLLEMDCWTDAQKAFIEEALGDDADWCELIDQLDARLRH